MGNAFDTANYPASEPTTLRVGNRWAWKRADLTDYPTADYSLKYSARLETSPATEIEITATESGSDYVVEVASTTTAGYSAGWYRWSAFITRTSDGERVEVSTGRWQVLPNTDASTADPRSDARIVLAKIDSLIAGRADSDVASYSIAGRSLAKMSIPDLLQWRDHYRAIVAAEEKADRLARGLGAPKLQVRF